MKIGVLALQGGFASHLKILRDLGISCVEVRHKTQLQECDGLILPGGESTTMFSLLQENHLEEAIDHFSQTRPLFGTCAGMILMAKKGWIKIAVERNAYGRQADSFITSVSLVPSQKEVKAVFIRAPKVQAILSKEVEILSLFRGEPILVKQGMHYAAAFHPELTDDPTIHLLFLETVSNLRC